jgi:hypothetical protein
MAHTGEEKANLSKGMMRARDGAQPPAFPNKNKRQPAACPGRSARQEAAATTSNREKRMEERKDLTNIRADQRHSVHTIRQQEPTMANLCPNRPSTCTRMHGHAAGQLNTKPASAPGPHTRKRRKRTTRLYLLRYYRLEKILCSIIVLIYLLICKISM